jgi:hypothetical protein
LINSLKEELVNMPTYNNSTNDIITYMAFDPLLNQNLKWSLTVYSGAQPTADTVQSNWTSYNSSNSIVLAHHDPFIPQGTYWSHQGTEYFSWITNANFQNQPSTTNSTAYFTNTATQFTGLTTAINTGTAAWAILWKGGLTAPQLAAPILANTQFYVVPVSDTSGIGIIRYTTATINIVGGTGTTPYDGGLSMALL